MSTARAINNNRIKNGNGSNVCKFHHRCFICHNNSTLISMTNSIMHTQRTNEFLLFDNCGIPAPEKKITVPSKWMFMFKSLNKLHIDLINREKNVGWRRKKPQNSNMSRLIASILPFEGQSTLKSTTRSKATLAKQEFSPQHMILLITKHP